uniref:2-C-methyl-D-erythritol 2,4-cyclodiphosphate synthase n=1 Tax=Bixa orellana TaxID=66672 RepID=A0A140CWP0_BIXOR|nr:2-C-methyl-D-erythritol 2,4-cyclodiphosphate synthase [Bixa orellana]
MATHLYTCSAVPTRPTTPKFSSKPLSLPLVHPPRPFNARHHSIFFSSSSSNSIPPALSPVAAASVTSVQVDEPTTSSKSPKTLPFRVGHGFDLHRLEPGYPLIIGGIDIPHDRGCEAHSDGDVLLHCVVDAILGALGLPDIGQIFPDSDPKWKGAPSSVFIKEAVRLMHEAGYEIGNLDATLILQRPKLSPHKEAIRTNLSQLLGADPSVVNLKAKTHEKVDSLGENRSIAAHTVILLMRK